MSLSKTRYRSDWCRRHDEMAPAPLPEVLVMMHLPKPRRRELYGLLPADAFSREDEGDDGLFYERPRLVDHVDQVALDTIERSIGTLIIEDRPAILDLMASVSSHLPAGLEAERVVGLGLNAEELRQNPVLSDRVIHDINRQPTVPFDDESFDVVLNTLSVDYLVRPVEIFREVGRILKPGGLHVCTFSNRMFRSKAVKIWLESGEAERVWLVEDYFRQADEWFEPPQVFSSRGKPRPADDRYAEHGIPSDPIFAVYGEKKGRSAERPVRPCPSSEFGVPIDPSELVARKAEVHRTLACPYCEQKLQKFDVAQSPFLEWDNEFVYVCFNNLCPYYVSGWDIMSKQGNWGYSYRLMYEPLRDRCMPVPTANAFAQMSGGITPRG